MTAAGPTPTAAKRVIVGVKVKFEINAKNGLRRVIFGLEKDTDGDNVTWKINFQLFERDDKTTPYGDPLVGVDVEVDTKLFPKAEALSKQDQMSAGQAAHAIGPAAQDAKAAKNGDIGQDEANATIQSTLTKK